MEEEKGLPPKGTLDSWDDDGDFSGSGSAQNHPFHDPNEPTSQDKFAIDPEEEEEDNGTAIVHGVAKLNMEQAQPLSEMRGPTGKADGFALGDSDDETDQDVAAITSRVLGSDLQAAQPAPKAADESEQVLVESIRAELAKPYTDRNAIKALCAGKLVPREVRGEVWKFLLGVSRKPDAMGTWQPSGQLKTAPLLRAECATEALKITGATREEQQERAEDMEMILMFYCHARGMEYRPGWAEIVRPVACLGLPVWAAYNCFYALLDKFIPYSHPNGGGAHLPYSIFRLLLQYHDPKLSHFLDTLRVDPHNYLYQWFRSLLVGVIADNNASLALWDAYLLESDPYLVFFMALVLLINARDAIMECKTASDVTSLLPDLPSPLAPEDTEDFTACALHYSTQTPSSIRQRELSSFLFATNTTAREDGLPPSVLLSMSELCLPVTATEVCMQQAKAKKNAAATILSQSSSPDRFKFFVIDVRPLSQFQSGRLPTAFHMAADMIFDQPEQFREVVQTLQMIDGDHLCFYGAGPEDAGLRTVLSFFLQREFRTISYVRGGYEAIHTLHNQGMVELTDHNKLTCHVCSPPPPTPTPAPAASSKQSSKDQQSGQNSGPGRPSLARLTSRDSGGAQVGGDNAPSPAAESGAARFWRRVSNLTPANSWNLEKEKNTDDKTTENDGNEDKGKTQAPKEKEPTKEQTENGPSPAPHTEAAGGGGTWFNTFAKRTEAMIQKGKDAIEKMQKEKELEAQAAKAAALPPRRNSGRKKSTDSSDGRAAANRNVFGIGDSDEERGSEGEEGGGSQERKASLPRSTAPSADMPRQMHTEDLSSMRRVNIEEWIGEISAVHQFPCSEILPSGAWMPSCIVATRDNFIILRTPMEHHPSAFVRESFPLGDLQKITAKKKHPNIVSFMFKAPPDHEIFGEEGKEVHSDGEETPNTPGEGPRVTKRFMLPNGRNCSKEVGKLVMEAVARQSTSV